MNSRQIESWALRVIDCVKKNQPNEDFLVELKREWIEPYKAARQIAGHANFAEGENILWLIGVDEIQGVIELDAANLANWYPSVESFFNELAPRMIPLNIPIEEKTIVALLFETDRAPYVVKNPAYGKEKGNIIEFEVPWRENTRIRTARRSDLIRLLAPLELLPEVEILSVSLKATIAGEDSGGNYRPDELRLTSELYIIPKNRDRVVIPFHRCQVEFEIVGISTFKADWFSLEPARGVYRGFGYEKPGSLTIQSTEHEIIINDPGKIVLEAISRRDNVQNGEISLTIHLLPTGAKRPIILTKTLPYPEAKLPN